MSVPVQQVRFAVESTAMLMGRPGKPRSFSMQLAGYFVRRVWQSMVGFGENINPMTTAQHGDVSGKEVAGPRTCAARDRRQQQQQQDMDSVQQNVQLQASNHQVGTGAARVSARLGGKCGRTTCQVVEKNRKPCSGGAAGAAAMVTGPSPTGYRLYGTGPQVCGLGQRGKTRAVSKLYL